LCCTTGSYLQPNSTCTGCNYSYCN
jgi:hypothetical protein